MHSMTINKRDLVCLQEYDFVILSLPFASSQCNLPSRPSYGRPRVVLHDMTLRSTICHLQLAELKFTLEKPLKVKVLIN